MFNFFLGATIVILFGLVIIVFMALSGLKQFYNENKLRIDDLEKRIDGIYTRLDRIDTFTKPDTRQDHLNIY